MACFWDLYEEYLEKVGRKKWIIGFKTKKKMSLLKLFGTNKVLM